LTNDGLKGIAECETLTELYLHRAAISDFGITELASSTARL
jgi:hypothetical protein